MPSSIRVLPSFRVSADGREDFAGFDVTINGGYFSRYPSRRRAEFAASCLRTREMLDQMARDAAVPLGLFAGLGAEVAA